MSDLEHRYNHLLTMKQREALASDPTAKCAQFQSMVYTLALRYGEELGLWLARRVASSIRKLKQEQGCLNCFRIAETTNIAELDEFTRVRDSGCCGSFETAVRHFKSGKAFIYGFNYGH